MTDEPVLLNTVLPLFFYDLIEDVREGPDAPKSKGFGTNDLSKMLPKDRRLQALVLLYEIGSKLDAVDRQVHQPGQRFTDPFIETAITKFSAATGLPEDDLRRVLKRPRLAAPAADGPAPPADDVLDPNFLDP